MSHPLRSALRQPRGRRLRPVAAVMAATGLLAVASLTVAPVTAEAAETFPTPTFPVRAPVASGFANPGLVHAGGEWITPATGDWDARGKLQAADELVGPWRSTGKPMLTKRASWMSTGSKGLWAPSIIKAKDNTYRLFFSGPIKQTAGGSAQRCIGAAKSADARGPFVPFDKPVACFTGAGLAGNEQAYDMITKPAAAAGRNFALIDPTASVVGGQMVLTYKTQWRQAEGERLWRTTTRMLRLDQNNPERVIANPVNADGGSVKLTDKTNKYIEENPVIVQRGDTFTLFTSLGWFGTCNYKTQWRQNGNLWRNWLDRTATDLSFPAGANTCGTGNAHVTRGLPENSWRIAFNGHTTKPTAGAGAAPKNLYIGDLGWSGEGTPRVKAMLS